MNEQDVCAALAEEMRRWECFSHATFCGVRELWWRLHIAQHVFLVQVAPYVRGSEGLMYITCERVQPQEEIKLGADLRTVPFPKVEELRGVQHAVHCYKEVLEQVLPLVRRDCTLHLRRARRRSFH